MPDVDTRSAQSDCTAISRAIGEPLLPSAPSMRGPLLLVEDPGPWAYDAIGRSRWVPDRLWPAAWEEHGVRICLVRRPGRTRGTGGRAFAVWPGGADGPPTWIESFRLQSADDLLDLDLSALATGRPPDRGELLDHPLVLVCAHGKVDRCCARFGRPVVAALHAAHPDITWETTHVGGCRLAANLVVLPDLAFYGRLTPEWAVEAVDRHLAGEVVLEHLRGVAGPGHAVQFAVAVARARDGALGHGDVTVLDAGSPEGRRRRVVVATPRNRHAVTVEEQGLATTAQGCGHDTLHTWTRHVVVDHHLTPGGR